MHRRPAFIGAAAIASSLLAASPGSARPGQTASAPPSHVTGPQAEALVREVSVTVERLRGLSFKQPVAVKVVDGTTARKHFEAELDDAAREKANHTRDAWAHLGLVPPSMNLVDAELRTAETEVLGYYESGSRTFRVLDHVPEAELRSVMAHELTHALEDQHYGLEALQKTAANEDHAVAIRAVIEGSAMVTTLWMLSREGGIGKAKAAAERAGQERAKTTAGSPTFVRMRLMLPYTLGFSFLLRGKPWEWLFDGVRMADVEQAYARPPHSTREILHPDQYWGGHRLAAPRVDLPDLSRALGEGWSQAATGSIGELGLTMMSGAAFQSGDFAVLLPTRWTTPGAEGTAGDVYHHYVNGPRKVTVLVTRWDSLRDVDEFQRHLRPGGGKKLFRLGANLMILAGDVGDRADALALEAAKSVRYWTGP